VSKTINKIADWTAQAGHLTGVLFLLSTVLLLIAEIIARRLFGSTTAITEEFAGYFCAAAIMLGAASTFAADRHIRTDIALTRLPPRVRLITEFFATLVALACAGFLLVGMGRQWLDTWNFQSRSFYPSRTLLWLPLALPLVGFLLLSLRLIAHVLNLRQRSHGQNPHD